MTANRDIWNAALERTDAGQPFVMMVVIDAEGSTPRNPGARMIWTPDDEFVGTVGGGQFEHLVRDAARDCFDKRDTRTERYVLGADADQCCGGRIDVFFEYVGARQRIVIFGAGHVAYEIARLLRPAPVETVIVDDRPEWNSAERFPHARRIDNWDDGVNACREYPDATLACVMTCSHDTDFDLLRNLLPQPPAFLGLIGSRSKRVCLFGRLVASGADEDAVKRIHCPIGVGDAGKEPPLVAVSIAAQLLTEARRLGVM